MKSMHSVIALLLVAAIVGIPVANAQNTAMPSTPPSQQAPTQTPTPVPGNTTVDPNQAPIQPVEPAEEQAQPAEQQAPVPQTNLPNAPSANMQQKQPQPVNPAGTAAAESAPTVGGPASKPGGTAIAPAKQKQVRSFLVKLGAIAAAGAAVGTIYALTRSTSSTPPGAR